jgi:hypothetical protein
MKSTREATGIGARCHWRGPVLPGPGRGQGTEAGESVCGVNGARDSH